MKYEVVDNFLDDSKFRLIKNLITESSADFPLYLINFVAEPKNKSDVYFVHTFYSDYKINSPFWDVLNPLVEKLDVKAFLRCRLNLYLQGSTIIEHGRHIDFPFTHKGIILYLNTNDGFTRLEDGTTISSVENRALFFDPSLMHNSTNCTDSKYRSVITVNYL